MGRLFVDQRMERPEVFPTVVGEVAVFSTRDPFKEESGEDAAAVLEYGGAGILVVADGVGGIPGGAAAARIAVTELRRAARRGAERGDPVRAAILDGIENANRAILARSAGGATTIAVLEVDGPAASARSFAVGDSMTFVLGGRGRIKHQSIPHSPVGYAVEAGLLDEREAMEHAERHLVSNSLGSDEMRIELGPRVALARLDTLVVGSDGLFDNVYVSELAERVCRGPLPRAAAKLAELALQRMIAPAEGAPSKPDDLTFVLCRPRRAPARAPRARKNAGAPCAAKT